MSDLQKDLDALNLTHNGLGDEIRRTAKREVMREVHQANYIRNPKHRTEVQTLLFSRSSWSVTAARGWAEEHGYVSSNRAFDITDDFIRVRQKEPSAFEEGSLRTIEFGEGIKAVVGIAR